MSDGLLNYKFRVFKEPQDVDEHPVHFMMMPLYKGWDGPKHMDEVLDFVFVLRPERDRHALAAMLAYAESVEDEDPVLAADLVTHVEALREAV